jgi:hypothetical protein
VNARVVLLLEEVAERVADGVCSRSPVASWYRRG